MSLSEKKESVSISPEYFKKTFCLKLDLYVYHSPRFSPFPHFIMLTSPCIVDPITSHFHSKTGVYRGV